MGLSKNTLSKNTLSKNTLLENTLLENTLSKIHFQKIHFQKIHFWKIHFWKIHIRKIHKNNWGPLSSTFHVGRPEMVADWKSESITNQPTTLRTDRQTWVGARDTCV